jgi:chromosome segregation ATPase
MAWFRRRSTSATSSAPRPDGDPDAAAVTTPHPIEELRDELAAIKERLDTIGASTVELERKVTSVDATSSTLDQRIDAVDAARIGLDEQLRALHDRLSQPLAPPPEPPPTPSIPEVVPEPEPSVDPAAIDELRARIDEVLTRLDAVDGRVTAVSTELARQLDELSGEIEALGEQADHGDGDAPAVTAEQLDALRDAQTRLANEQARYQIAFRADLAELAERIRRPGV